MLMYTETLRSAGHRRRQRRHLRHQGQGRYLRCLHPAASESATGRHIMCDAALAASHLRLTQRVPSLQDDDNDGVKVRTRQRHLLCSRRAARHGVGDQRWMLRHRIAQ